MNGQTDGHTYGRHFIIAQQRPSAAGGGYQNKFITGQKAIWVLMDLHSFDNPQYQCTILGIKLMYKYKL